MTADYTLDPVRIRVSTAAGANPEGGTSAYLLPERGVLVDPGPPGDTAWETLVDGIESTGLAVDDVDHVLVTHWHGDHMGNAPRLASAADADLWLHERDAPLVADYAAERARRLERDAETLERWGVPQPRTEHLLATDSSSPVPETAPVHELQDGDEVAGLEAVHTPGHTAGHVAFVPAGAPSSGTQGFVGDAVLGTITPNVGGGDTRQKAPLEAYRETLSRLDARVTAASPGHGEAFELGPRIAAIRGHHRERAARVLATLAENEPATPWAVATTLFGDMCGIHVKFGAGEAFAHLRDLAEQGVVEQVGDLPLRFELSSGVEAASGTLDAVWTTD
ncbi:MBL fold metallo-hydrolase [Haloarchaeobius sp. TZWWS8]|uniref:MBL fold metallo-hydrolase n=1 Tax=Haloarchaeobius sp. TZWWS8 TaxID=3446121 RepID=UPI003EB7261D